MTEEVGTVVRKDYFAMHVNPAEHELIAAVAKHLERTESDTIRLLVREKARELGVTETQKSSPPA